MKQSPSHPASSILITGASSGIGAALAVEYARPEVTLYLGGRDTDRLEQVADKCRGSGASVLTRALDVTDRAGMEQWIRACDAHNPLDLVIANAGVSSGVSTSPVAASDISAINVGGVFNTVEPAVACMRTRHRGQIAIMSSLAGLRGMPSAPAYSASKVAVRAYGEALRPGLAMNGIGISVILPGFVESRITDQNRFHMPMMMPASRAARIIRNGLAHNKARIAFPLPLYVVVWILAAMPTMLADMILARLPRKE